MLFDITLNTSIHLPTSKIVVSNIYHEYCVEKLCMCCFVYVGVTMVTLGHYYGLVVVCTD